MKSPIKLIEVNPTDEHVKIFNDLMNKLDESEKTAIRAFATDLYRWGEHDCLVQSAAVSASIGIAFACVVGAFVIGKRSMREQASETKS